MVILTDPTIGIPPRNFVALVLIASTRMAIARRSPRAIRRADVLGDSNVGHREKRARQMLLHRFRKKRVDISLSLQIKFV